MYLAQLGTQRRRGDHIAGLPAGDVISLAERADNEGALIQLLVGQHAGMAHAVVDQVFIHFIADQVDIAVSDKPGQLVEVFSGNQRTAGVVR
ncbi:hypothetical protein D3C81_1982910 [compost metagenome]